MALKRPHLNVHILTLNVPVLYKIQDLPMRVTAVPRVWAALEPHFPRASHSRPAHSSRGSAVPSQLASSVHSHAFAGRNSAHFPALGSYSSAHFHAIWSRCFRAFWSSYKPRIPTHSHAFLSNKTRDILCIPTKLQIVVSNVAMASYKHRRLVQKVTRNR